MEALNHVAMEADEKTQQALGRLCNIWKERNVFEKHLLHELKQALSGKSEPKEAEAPPVKKSKLDQTKLEQLPLSLREEIAADISDSPKEPPDAEELVRALQDLENSASTDAAVRERIAALPPEVSDIAMLEKIKDRETVDRLSREVEDASLLLAEYNSRLSKELEERKHIAQMLKDFIAFQKDQLTESEKRLDEYKQKLGKVSEVRNELRSHIQNLPDLSLLPDVTGGLKPLPSAGDLFAKE
ncbi:regulation of nuclear pre-mRNA domain-containing protein 1B isoform X2 [Lingula anatina]|nr:regulation of nuclear pre-mRNA domain-containing protein 1B isoform X2 [Lingula anatina]|eukprot:XP_013403831.1 regulation of nuclear pre-mRNA domain-containing protein 1B isoform X2 [Lingula anatina]